MMRKDMTAAHGEFRLATFDIKAVVQLVQPLESHTWPAFDNRERLYRQVFLRRYL